MNGARKQRGSLTKNGKRKRTRLLRIKKRQMHFILTIWKKNALEDVTLSIAKKTGEGNGPLT